ncbi:MAG TPA: hypothetical protein PLW39_03335 [Thermoflexales bacterium]|nr:hypothetical protein [Thermoflexales bacterium]HQZ21281.1 hypothetical protein [Thermoflexales bacterium]
MRTRFAGPPAQHPGGRARALTLTQISVGLAFALSILITILPYLVNNPAVPFGSDMQHPQAMLNLLETGKPLQLYPDYLNQQYPNTYSYLLAVVVKLMKLDPLASITLVTSLCMAASLAAIYYFVRSLYGQTAAAFSLLAYGILSFQPRQTFLDGTRIELVSGLVLVPLCLLALQKTLTVSGYRWSALGGILFGALIRYHFIGTVQAGIVAVIFFVLVAFARRDLITRAALARLLILAGVALLISLPYSFFYLQVALKIVLGRLGLTPVAAEQEAVFPPIAGFDEILLRMGMPFFLAGFASFSAVMGQKLIGRKVKTADLLLLAWVIMLCIGSFTPALLVPERFLRNLALPLSIGIGVFLASLGKRQFLAPMLMALLMVISLPSIIDSMIFHGTQTLYATTYDLPSLGALKEISHRDSRTTLTDDSGVWMPYFVGEHSRYIAGGPEGFLWFGEPLRSEMRELWQAHLDPCSPASAATFSKFDIGYIYVGARPRHWTLPGYIYVDGNAYLACPNFKTDYSEDTPNGKIFIFERLAAPSPAPAWVPPGGLSPQNALQLTPPIPAPGSAEETYFRMWHRDAVLASAKVIGLSNAEIMSRTLAAPGASSEHLLQEVMALRRAARVGVEGNPAAPYEQFKLYLIFGQPDVWPPTSLPYALAVDKPIELPRTDEFTPAIQWWYAANRAKYNTVYYGVEDADPAIHLGWAKAHNDVDLYNEITALWSAAQDGVVGSTSAPRQAYDAWLAKKLAK